PLRRRARGEGERVAVEPSQHVSGQRDAREGAAGGEATDLTPQRPHRPVDRGAGVAPGIGHGAELVADQTAHQAGPAVRADLLAAGGPMQLLEGPGPLLLTDRGLEHRVDLLDGRSGLEPGEPVAADGLRAQLAQRLEVDAGELA